MFAGDGGDEIFGGNARYAKQMLFEHYCGLPTWFRKGLVEPVTFAFPFAQHLLPVRKLQSYVRQANVPLPDRLEAYNLLHRQPLDEVFEQDFLTGVDTEAPIAALLESYFDTDSTHPVNRMLHLDMKFTLADNDLRKVVCMAEAAGVEVIFPMLDDDLVAFSCGLPPSDKVHHQTLRWFYKKALRGFLPDTILDKSKHGFGLPFGPWALSHEPLKELVYTRLDELARRRWVRPEYIQTLRNMHAEVHPVYYGTMIWILVTLESWLQARKL
jgi:asparagine synthase (glutamine-hydrolysing)